MIYLFLISLLLAVIILLPKQFDALGNEKGKYDFFILALFVVIILLLLAFVRSLL